MFNVLLAEEITAGRFRKVLTASARNDGGLSLADKWNGSIESYAVRSAARMMADDSAIADVNFEFADGQIKYRATRY